ncbi:hypothetical protein LOZ39_006548 [Ophidiomyces ophidiicola]|nr:hypothetical protein LOZ64_006429 [Ophidiomyces ophidiicola]KAI2000309.1 hypothetical protein LOZ50_006049 [Ophidiomyces ophidiicola]KAI2002771.1 hypothetical protein LOZ49_006188 [Ophidiomyces ophidiicola]KAI2031024.1 hypothetical protein LOZ47_006273 [Ophidiomyces ophidiicola]KAI2044255.1 hypothetical protein LOZ44_005096 [Ophidiomyces ophidiicola]
MAESAKRTGGRRIAAWATGWKKLRQKVKKSTPPMTQAPSHNTDAASPPHDKANGRAKGDLFKMSVPPQEIATSRPLSSDPAQPQPPLKPSESSVTESATLATTTSTAPAPTMNSGTQENETGIKQNMDKPSQPESEPKLSNAELKKRAKAEKAARRAKEKQEREQQAGAGGGGAPDLQAGQQAGGAKKGGAGKQDSKQSQKKGDAKGGLKQSGTVAAKQISVQRRGSIHIPAAEAKKKKKTDDENTVAVFGHLPWHSRRAGIAGVGKEIHPAVVALGMQLRDYVICGSSARCVATLLALKRVVQAYITPVGTSLSRHLTTYLSHQINYLTTCRPLSISQGNAIRALKLEITTIDPSDSEDDAKHKIYDFIDNYICEKYTVASQVIANSAAEKIKDGDVILCYASSSVVQKALLTAHAQEKKFRVSIIDSRPLFEGKNLARTLSKAGVEVQYSLINGITYAIREATKVFLGAHAMTSNGCLFSRVGTALVAMSAKERAGGINIPVIVCCETAKFTDRVALDSIVVNEIADADELVAIEPSEQVTQLSPPAPAPASKGASKTSVANAEISSLAASLDGATPVIDPDSPLQNWREMKNLQLLSTMHDVTPAQYIDMVITEMGSLPPSAVPIVHRMSTESEEKDSRSY